jgi:endonuclease/exonuclease/phosphatase family metal-dependent hydrolase
MASRPEPARSSTCLGRRPALRFFVVGLAAISVVARCGVAWAASTPLNVVTWNIRIDDGSEAHARTVMDLLLATTPQPEVIVIQEAYQQWFSVYVDELQKKTGRTWYGAFATECGPGNWNGSKCTVQYFQGIGIFSTHTITSTSSTLFPFPDCWTSARAGLRAAIDVAGTTVQVFVTHLQTGSCSDVRQARNNSMSQLKSWAANYSRPQIVAGDFNADADQIDTTLGMLPNFIDAWSIVGSGPGFTAFVPTPTMKLDYWFADAGGLAKPTSTAVVTSTGSASDHYPVRATFVIQSAAGAPSTVTGLRFIVPKP